MVEKPEKSAFSVIDFFFQDCVSPVFGGFPVFPFPQSEVLVLPAGLFDLLKLVLFLKTDPLILLQDL